MVSYLSVYTSNIIVGLIADPAHQCNSKKVKRSILNRSTMKQVWQIYHSEAHASVKFLLYSLYFVSDHIHVGLSKLKPPFCAKFFVLY